jgi:RimJ/RimL family protein N-acetyltransferase
MPSFPELKDPLAADDVALRFASERDIPEILIAYQDDPELHLRMGQSRPPSAAELGRFAERAEPDRIAGARLTLSVLERGSDVCRGQVHVEQVDWDGARAELRIWLAPQSRGKGLARSALSLAGGWLLRSCGLERVQILADPENEAVIAAAESAGFVREGVLHGYARGRGARVDAVVLSLLPGDLRS